jgi:hypothetical protein
MKLRKVLKVYVILSFLIYNLVACQSGVPKEALMLSPESLADRQLQTRVFETNDEMKLLAASAALLQDLGFTIDQSEVGCGVIVSSRDRDVTEAGEVIMSMTLAVLLGIYHPYATTQKVLASLVTRPLDGKRIAVRITFQHMVWNVDNKLVKNESINEPEIYQEFFSKLSKSVFLVAHEI